MSFYTELVEWNILENKIWVTQLASYYSILNGWMIPFSKAMKAYNIDSKKALKECNIDLKSKWDPEARLESEELSNLVNYCNNKLMRHDFSILIAEQFHPAMFHTLGYAMMSSNTLQDALERFAHYKRVLSNASLLSNWEKDGQYIFEVIIANYETTNRPILPFVAVEAFLATIVRFTRQLIGLDFAPEKVYFASPKPSYDVTYLEDFFKCEIEFSSGITAIAFNLEQTKEKLMCGNPLITHTHEKMLNDIMARVDKSDLTHVIKNKIFDLLPLGAPSQTDIAEYLGMSLRNLQRKLQNQGTSYKEILENTRKKLAINYILQQHLSFSEISYLVGFSSVGNFNRAFKRWTNETPGNYRKNNKA